MHLHQLLEWHCCDIIVSTASKSPQQRTSASRKLHEVQCSAADSRARHGSVASQRARTSEHICELDLVIRRALEQGHIRQLVTDLQHVAICSLPCGSVRQSVLGVHYDLSGQPC